VARPAAIAVTGATGAVGGAVATRLSRKGLPQRLVVRDAERAPRLSGGEVAEASYEDADAMRDALREVETLFLVSATESPDRVRQHTTAIDAAVAAGVKRVVYLSFIGAAPDATFTFARDHFHTEQHVRASGLGHTFLRSSLYADQVPYFCSIEGVIQGPAGEGRVSWVTREDVAAAAASVLTGDGHEGSAYDITGPAALTMEQTAAALAEITGRKISFRDETIEGARASRSGSGPGWQIEGWVSSYAAIARGEMATVTDAVTNLTGHEPQSLISYLRTHPETYQHLLVARYRHK
jgi:NAD(P)H dehydrogenase (quinone)